jgi:uncharacterized OsmC-like protein
MTDKINARYLGNKRMELRHEQSGATITTDAPKDNCGQGESFSPTDMVAGALGACAMTIISIVAERDGIDIAGMCMEAEKEMAAAPRRIAAIPVTIHLPAKLSQVERAKLEGAAKACPVANSLHPDVKANFKIVYDL